MSTMQEDFKYMDIRGADMWSGFALLKFSPVTFFSPQESIWAAGNASILEKVALISMRIRLLSERWIELPIRDRRNIIAAMRFFCDALKQAWRWTKYACLTARVISRLMLAMG